MELVTAHGNLVFWMLLMFSILLFILGKFAWKPILKALKDRENSIREALESADKAKEDMAALQADNEKVLNEARKERDALLKEAKEIKDKIIAEAKEKASAEAVIIAEKAKKQIIAEKDAAIEEMKKQIVIVSVEVAEKILSHKLASDKDQQSLIEDILKDIKLN